MCASKLLRKPAAEEGGRRRANAMIERGRKREGKDESGREEEQTFCVVNEKRINNGPAKTRRNAEQLHEMRERDKSGRREKRAGAQQV
jgi:hypothetical protein